MRTTAVIICGLVFFCLCGFMLENSSRFSSSEKIIRSKSVPTALLKYGTLGKVFAQLGLIKIVENDGSVFAPTESQQVDTGTSVFEKKRQVGEYLFEANSTGMEDFPSSVVINEKKFIGNWPLISIVVDDESLYGPEKGIVTNYNERGQQWERLGYVSYYENKKLLFATGAGVRLHGGESRRPPSSAKEEIKQGFMFPETARKKRLSLRLYFRDDYGANEIPKGLLFGGAAKSVKTLVVHFERVGKWPLQTCMTYDIVNQLGAVAPEAKPVLFYLNGKYRGTYFICEHISKKQWARRLGNKDFAFIRYKGSSDEDSKKVYNKMVRWAVDGRKRMTLEDARKYIDVENLSCFIFSHVFCGSEDSFQGAAILDRQREDARWFWINWDMDVTSWRGKADSRDTWELGLPRKYCNGLQGILFSRLITESSEYREYFIRLVAEMLNHRVNRKYLSERIKYYDQMAKDIGKKKQDFLCNRGFFDGRADYIVERMAGFPFFGGRESYTCQLEGSEQGEYVIDGYPESAGYRGRYFKGMPIVIKVEKAPKNKRFDHWLVNGSKVITADLSWPIQSDTVIQAVFE